MSPDNIWPNFRLPDTEQPDQQEARVPIALLNELAVGLSTKTNGLVVAQIDTSTFGELVLYSFTLVVPNRNNYSYRLFKVEQHGINPYPVWVRDFSFGGNMGDGRIRCDSDDAFLVLLSEIVNSNSTKQLIDELMMLAMNRPIT